MSHWSIGNSQLIQCCVSLVKAKTVPTHRYMQNKTAQLHGSSTPKSSQKKKLRNGRQFSRVKYNAETCKVSQGFARVRPFKCSFTLVKWPSSFCACCLGIWAADAVELAFVWLVGTKRAPVAPVALKVSAWWTWQTSGSLSDLPWSRTSEFEIAACAGLLDISQCKVGGFERWAGCSWVESVVKVIDCAVDVGNIQSDLVSTLQPAIFLQKHCFVSFSCYIVL